TGRQPRLERGSSRFDSCHPDQPLAQTEARRLGEPEVAGVEPARLTDDGLPLRWQRACFGSRRSAVRIRPPRLDHLPATTVVQPAAMYTAADRRSTRRGRTASWWPWCKGSHGRL